FAPLSIECSTLMLLQDGEVVAVHRLVQPEVPERRLDLRRLLPGDESQLVRAVGRQPAREGGAGGVHQVHRVALVEVPLHLPDAGREQALLPLQHRPLGAFVHAVRALRRLWRRSNSVPTGFPRSTCRNRPGTRPEAITQRTPTSVTLAAARTLVLIPPVPTPLTAPPASANISGVTSGISSSAFASGLVRGSESKTASTSERMTSASASSSAATSPARVSLSPNLISSMETVSFSLMIGTTRSSMSRVSAWRAL